MTDQPQNSLNSESLLVLCCKTLDDAKAADILALDVREVSSLTNYLVLATALAEPHLKALRREVDKALKDQKVAILGVEEGEASGWTVVDAVEVMIHIFDQETRETYKLESLWKDAKRLEPLEGSGKDPQVRREEVAES